jgi:hypothetical protein
MSFMDVYCATKYVIDNPPAGAVIQAVVEAYCKGASKGKKGGSNSSNNSSYESNDDGGQAKPDDWDELSKEEQFKWEEVQLKNLMAVFGMSGGVVRDRKKGE